MAGPSQLPPKGISRSLSLVLLLLLLLPPAAAAATVVGAAPRGCRPIKGRTDKAKL
jgi:hypothetical protein